MAVCHSSPLAPHPVPPHPSHPPPPRFPSQVLGSFIRSFGVLNELAYKSETQVLEDYLEQQWRENEGELGPEPAGDGAIALMRLVVQAQIADKQKAMVSAFAAFLSIPGSPHSHSTTPSAATQSSHASRAI